MMLLGLILAMIPLVVAMILHADTMQTPRLNLQRISLASTEWLRPFEEQSFTFTASQDDLSEVRIFMRPPLLAALGDRYSVYVEDLETGESYSRIFSPRALWNDVGRVTFPPFETSEGHDIRVTLEAPADNRDALELARAYQNDEFIFQPYYKEPLSFWGAVGVLVERLGWRCFPLLLVFVMVPWLTGRLYRFYA